MVEGIDKIERIKYEVRYVHYSLTTYCNFKCSYCVQGLERQDDELQDNDYYVRASRRLSHHLDYLQEIYPMPAEEIELIGGEISTLNLVEIVKPLLESGRPVTIIQIVSNMTGYKNLLELAKYLKTKNVNMRMLCSWHEEFMSKKAFWERVDYLRENNPGNMFIKPTFVVHDENTEEASDFMKEAKSRTTRPNSKTPLAFAINIKREREGDARNGRTKPPYATEIANKWLDENYDDSRDGDNVIVNGTQEISRRTLTNKYGGRIDTIGMICKDRHKVVRFSPERGLRFSCGLTGDDCHDIVCPQVCSLCSVSTVERENKIN